MQRWQLQQQTVQMQETAGQLQQGMQQTAEGALSLTEERARSIEGVAWVSPLPMEQGREVLAEGV